MNSHHESIVLVGGSKPVRGIQERVLRSHIYLGKLQYFTNLKSSAMNGDDFPKINHDSRLRENSEVVIIYPDI
jgi:hypothetical protein